MEFIKGSTITYLAQTDLKGDIVDANNGFIHSFNHIRPTNILQVIAPVDIRKIIVLSERVKRLSELRGEMARVIFECRTIDKEKEYSYGLFEVAFIRSKYFILGYDLFVSYEDGKGRIKRYEKLLSEIIFILNHEIRSRSSNISGLLSVADVKDQKIINNIFAQAEEMDKEILMITEKINKIKK